MKLTWCSLLVAALVPLSLTLPGRSLAAPKFSLQGPGQAHAFGQKGVPPNGHPDRAMPRRQESEVRTAEAGASAHPALTIQSPQNGATGVRPDVHPQIAWTGRLPPKGRKIELTGLLWGGGKLHLLAPGAFSAQGGLISLALPPLSRYTHYRLWVHPGRGGRHGDFRGQRPPLGVQFETGSALHEPTHIHLQLPPHPTASAPFALGVQVTDDYGLAADGGKITLTVSGRAPVTRSLSPSMHGRVTFLVTDHRAGSLPFHLALSGPYPQDQKHIGGVIHVAPGPPSTLSLHPAARAIVAGSSVPLALHPALTDRFGNPLPLSGLQITATGATITHVGPHWQLTSDSSGQSLTVQAKAAGLSTSVDLTVLHVAAPAALSPTSVTGFTASSGGYRGAGSLTFASAKGLALVKLHLSGSAGTVSIHFMGDVFTLSAGRLTAAVPGKTATSAPVGASPYDVTLENLKGHVVCDVNGTVLGGAAGTSSALSITASGGTFTVGPVLGAKVKTTAPLLPHQEAFYGGPGLPASTSIRFEATGQITVQSFALTPASLRFRLEGGGLNETFAAMPPFQRTLSLKGRGVYTLTVNWPDQRASIDLDWVGTPAVATSSVARNP